MLNKKKNAFDNADDNKKMLFHNKKNAFDNIHDTKKYIVPPISVREY